MTAGESVMGATRSQGTAVAPGEAMHELSIARAIVAVGERHLPSGAATVHAVRVAIGAASGIVADALDLAFRAAAADTRLRGARLIVERVPARGRCHDCGRDYLFADLVGICPRCGGLGGELLGGEHLELRSIEVSDV
jgi:hydrogenase nickel incorporation protein HypA/HybF